MCTQKSSYILPSTPFKFKLETIALHIQKGKCLGLQKKNKWVCEVKPKAKLRLSKKFMTDFQRCLYLSVLRFSRVAISPGRILRQDWIIWEEWGIENYPEENEELSSKLNFLKNYLIKIFLIFFMHRFLEIIKIWIIRQITRCTARKIFHLNNFKDF